MVGLMIISFNPAVAGGRGLDADGIGQVLQKLSQQARPASTRDTDRDRVSNKISGLVIHWIVLFIIGYQRAEKQDTNIISS